MDRNRIAGFGFVLFGLSFLRPILTTGIGNIGAFNLLLAIGGIALASLGAQMAYRGGTSESGFAIFRRVGASLAFAATFVFIGAVAYAFVG